MLDKNFITDRHSAILGNLMDNGYLTKKDCEILKLNWLSDTSGDYDNISKEKAEIVKKAILDNSARKFK